MCTSSRLDLQLWDIQVALFADKRIYLADEHDEPWGKLPEILWQVLAYHMAVSQMLVNCEFKHQKKRSAKGQPGVDLKKQITSNTA